MATQTKENQITLNKKLYDIDQEFKSWSNLDSYVQESQDFYNGKQYPNFNYKGMIRVTLNICSMNVTIKASKICGTPLYLAFTSDNPDIDCTELRRFDEYTTSKMHLQESNYQAAINGFVDGTEITFIRWDSNDTSYKGIYKGGLVEEHIDLRNFAVADRTVQDIQNQEWVMYWFDAPYGAVKKMCEGTKKEIKEKQKQLLKDITIDAKNKEDQAAMEANNNALVKVYVRFFRVNGEVYSEAQTDTVNLYKVPHPLSKKLSKQVISKVIDEYYKNKEKGINDNQTKELDYNIDFDDLLINTDKKVFTDKEYADQKDKFSLYPFAVFRPFARNGTFYGRSDLKAGLIPIQKGLNFIISMLLKVAENNAYNKIFAKPDALQGQTITNEPSQIIYDYSPFQNSWGIKFAESQPLPNGLLQFAQELLGMARVVYGFNDVMDGSITNQDMSGVMLQQMIKQSNTSIEQQQQLFWKYNEEKAAIRLMYYKHYVDSAKYTYQLSDSEYEGEEQARQIIYSRLLKGEKLNTLPDATPEEFANPTTKARIKEIKGEHLYGSNFDITIDAMQGLADSKLVEQQFFDNLLLNGNINNMQPEILDMYLQASPNVSPRTKTALKNVVENLKQSKIRMLEQQYSDLMQKTSQIVDYARQLEARVGYQGTYLKNLQDQFKGTINNYNKLMGGMAKDMENMQKQQKEIKGVTKEQEAEATVK